MSSSVSLIPPLILFTGGWLVWWGLSRRGALQHLPQDWARVDGTVVDAGGGAGRPARIEYRAPDGRRLRVPAPPSVPMALGTEVALLLDPADPTRARLASTTRDAARVIWLMVATGVVLVAVGLATAAALL